MDDPSSATLGVLTAPSGPPNNNIKDLRRKERCWMIRSGKESDILSVEVTMEECGSKYDFVQYQLEQGSTTGFKHVQGMIYHNNKIKGTTLQNMFPAGTELQVGKSVEALLQYTSKSETRISGPFSWGIPPEQGKRHDLIDHCQQFMYNEPKFLNEHPDVYIRYHKGFTSLKQKSWKHRQTTPQCVSLTTNEADTLIQTLSDYYIKDKSNFWNGYEQQEAVFIQQDWWISSAPFGIEKNWNINVNTKGSFIPFNSPYIYIVRPNTYN